jgi:hypothetical protein
LLYQKSDGKWWKADADAAASMPGLRMALESKIADQTCSMLVKGRVQDNDWNWTVGSVLYAGLTAGSISEGVPSSGNTIYKQVVGVAYHADKMLFMPSPIVVPRTAVYDDVVVQLTEPLADDSAGPSRIQELVTVGEAVAFPDLLYLKSDGKWWKADADAATSMPGLRMALETKAADGVCQVLRMGRVRDDGWAWTVGGLIYASTTAGGLTQTAPSGSGDQVQVVGIAHHADKMIFDPSPVIAEVV